MMYDATFKITLNVFCVQSQALCFEFYKIY